MNAIPDPWVGPIPFDEAKEFYQSSPIGLDPVKEKAKVEGGTPYIVDIFLAKTTAFALFGHCLGLAGGFTTDGSLFSRYRLAQTKYNVEALTRTVLKNLLHQAHVRSNDKTKRKAPENDIKKVLFCYKKGDGQFGIVFKKDGVMGSSQSDKIPDGEECSAKVIGERVYEHNTGVVIEGVPVFHQYKEPQLVESKDVPTTYKGDQYALKSTLTAEPVMIPLGIFTDFARHICDQFEELIVAAGESGNGWKTTRSKGGKETPAKVKAFRYLVGRINQQINLEEETRQYFQVAKNMIKPRAQAHGKELANLLEREDFFKNELSSIAKAWQQAKSATAQDQRAKLIPPPEIKFVTLIKKLQKMTVGIGGQLNDLKKLAMTYSYEKRKNVLAPLTRTFAGALNYMEKDERCNYIVPLFELMRLADQDHPDNKGLIPRFMYWQGRQHRRRTAFDSLHYRTHREDSLVALLSVYGGDTPINNLRHFFGAPKTEVENFTRTWTSINSNVIAGQPKEGDVAFVISREEEHPEVRYMVDTKPMQKRDALNGFLNIGIRSPAIRGVGVNLAKGATAGMGQFIKFAKDILGTDLFSKGDNWVAPTWNATSGKWVLDPLEKVNFLDLPRNLSGRALVAKDGPYAGSLETEMRYVFFVHDLRQEAAQAKQGRFGKTPLSVAALSLLLDKDIATQAAKRLQDMVVALAQSWGLPYDPIALADGTSPLFPDQPHIVPAIDLRTMKHVPTVGGTPANFGGSFIPTTDKDGDEKMEEVPRPPPTRPPPAYPGTFFQRPPPRPRMPQGFPPGFAPGPPDPGSTQEAGRSDPPPNRHETTMDEGPDVMPDSQPQAAGGAAGGAKQKKKETPTYVTKDEMAQIVDLYKAGDVPGALKKAQALLRGKHLERTIALIASRPTKGKFGKVMKDIYYGKM